MVDDVLSDLDKALTHLSQARRVLGSKTGFSLLKNGTLTLEGRAILDRCECGDYLVDHYPYPTLDKGCSQCKTCRKFRPLEAIETAL